jgi:hypothetical protein
MFTLNSLWLDLLLKIYASSSAVIKVMNPFGMQIRPDLTTHFYPHYVTTKIMLWSMLRINYAVLSLITSFS